MSTKWFTAVGLLGCVVSLAIGGSEVVVPAAQIAALWHLSESVSLTLVGLTMLVAAHHLRRLHSSPRPVSG